MPGPYALQFLLATFAGWVNRAQAQVIGYQAEVIRVLKEQLGDKRALHLGVVQLILCRRSRMTLSKNVEHL